VVHALRLILSCALTIGMSCWFAAVIGALVFRSRSTRPRPKIFQPPVSLLKPVYGLEKHLLRNLRTACLQDYPNYQVVYSVQRSDDPAIPVLLALQHEFGVERVSVAIETVQVGLNGKINNLAGALPHARHEIIVISDSDVWLRPDYLSNMVAPLEDPAVGAVSSFFRATHAGPWYEQMELLTINADHFAIAMLGYLLRLADFCFGASTALRRQTLDEIGGLSVLGDYLVEDNEMGQRVLRTGKRLVAIPYVVDTMVDLSSAAEWWKKQTYWDQNTRAAVPGVFAASLVLRIIPLSILFAAMSGFDATGCAVILLAVGLRLLAASVVLSVALRDTPSLRSVWLVPIKDCLSLIWFVRAFVTRTVVWRGVQMGLTRDGRLHPLAARDPAIHTEASSAPADSRAGSTL
jgi:ceramide glucosyltransferase